MASYYDGEKLLLAWKTFLFYVVIVNWCLHCKNWNWQYFHLIKEFKLFVGLVHLYMKLHSITLCKYNVQLKKIKNVLNLYIYSKKKMYEITFVLIN